MPAELKLPKVVDGVLVGVKYNQAASRPLLYQPRTHEQVVAETEQLQRDTAGKLAGLNCEGLWVFSSATTIDELRKKVENRRVGLVR